MSFSRKLFNIMHPPRQAATVRHEYQPKTGAKCSCRRGIERDNCPNCEGTGHVIDFAAIRRRNGGAS